jgi:hypothetical protein
MESRRPWAPSSAVPPEILPRLEGIVGTSDVGDRGRPAPPLKLEPRGRSYQTTNQTTHPAITRHLVYLDTALLEAASIARLVLRTVIRAQIRQANKRIKRAVRQPRRHNKRQLVVPFCDIAGMSCCELYSEEELRAPAGENGSSSICKKISTDPTSSPSDEHSRRKQQNTAPQMTVSSGVQPEAPARAYFEKCPRECPSTSTARP